MTGSAPAAALAPGTVLAGDYRIQRALAQGGMGVVYVAEQLSTGKLRAIKTMHRELLSDEKLRQRFEQEAKVAARIESDHIVETVGAGIDAATATPWLAMELLDGVDLAAYLQQKGALAFDEARDLLGQLCHALAAAHRVGVVHRDLKPENIFVAKPRQPGARFRVKVLDFGIAKVVAEARAHTQVTAALGTPRYMAPEQSESSAHVSPATDVWALALITYQVLTGRWYWNNATPREGSSVVQLMREILFEPIEPASVRSSRQGGAVRLPAGFDAWFGRCLARESHARFADAGQAWAALDPILGAAGAAAGAAPIPASVAATGPTAISVGEAMPPHPYAAAPAWPTPAGPPAPAWPTPAAPLGVGAGWAAHPSAPGGTGNFAHTAARPKRGGGIALLVVLALLGLGAVAVVGVVVVVARGGALLPGRDPTGTYAITVGQNPDGKTGYAGSVLVAKTGDAYRIAWSLAKGPGYEGVALTEGDLLGVGWAQTGRYGVAVYRVDGGRLSGRWTSTDLAGKVGTEELTGPAGLRGSYQITESSAGYTGSVTITPNGDVYDVSWVVGATTMRGVGLKRGDVLIVGWAFGGPVGVVSYRIEDGKLVGTWAMAGDGRTGRETLTRK